LEQGWRPIDLWDAVSDSYLRYTIHHPNQDVVLSVLREHLRFAENRESTRLEVIILHAIAYWYFERSKKYERTIETCDVAIPIVEQLADNAKRLKEIYTLRADGAYALKDYENARANYTQAASFFPRSGPFSVLDVIIQYKIGDCCWYLDDYRAAASAYLRASKMRGGVSRYNHADSFQLFGKLSLAYLCMGFYWHAVRLHEKMLSVYERFQVDTMFVRMGASLQGILVEAPGSKLCDLDAMYRGQLARPRHMGPEFYDAPIRTEGLQALLNRNSLASFRFLLAQAYDTVGDIANAIRQAEISLCTEHTSSYIPEPIIRFVTHDLLSRLFLKNGEKIASARAAFNEIALVEDLSKLKYSHSALESELWSEEHLAQVEQLNEILDTTPSLVAARAIFRSSVEPVILGEINRRRGFNEQVMYFLALTDMASRLPSTVGPCVEAWIQLYLGIFYLTRGYRQESKIAFERMRDLISEHGLLDVEFAYLLYTTFFITPLLYSTAEDLINACVKTALRLIDRLPDSQFWLGEFNEQFAKTWFNRIHVLAGDSLAEEGSHAISRWQNWFETIVDVEELFFHLCALLLLFTQNNDFWSDDARTLQRKILSKPLNQLESDETFELYDGFGKFAREEAQRQILDGNIRDGQALARALHDTMSSVIERCHGKLSSEQLSELEEHRKIATLWSD